MGRSRFGVVGGVLRLCALVVALSGALIAAAGMAGGAWGGEVLAFSASDLGNEAIYLMDVQRETWHRLIGTTGYDQNPVWSPDGSRLAFSGTWIEAGKASTDIWTTTAAGRHPQRVTLNDEVESELSWTSDGRAITFLKVQSGDNRTAVYRSFAVDVETGAEQPIPSTRAFYDLVGVSAAGSWIVGALSRTPNEYDLYTVSSSGAATFATLPASDARPPDDLNFLTATALNEYNPIWSPDGTRIAYEVYEGNGLNIYTINADGTDAVRLTDASGNDFAPSWSRDGSQIAFLSHREGFITLYLMNADGSDQRPLVPMSSVSAPHFRP